MFKALLTLKKQDITNMYCERYVYFFTFFVNVVKRVLYLYYDVRSHNKHTSLLNENIPSQTIKREKNVLK